MSCLPHILKSSKLGKQLGLTKDTAFNTIAEIRELIDNKNQPTEIKPKIDSSKKIEEREYTPEKITELKPNEVFVFGSNAEGAHGKGAALLAKQKFGAKQGQAEGLQGQSYAIITKKNWRVEKSSTLEEIGNGIMKFVSFASQHPEKKFYVTKIGSALAGYTLQEIKQVWKDVNTQWESEIFSDIPNNIILPKEYEIRTQEQPIVEETKEEEKDGCDTPF